jgi:hypothetical protein
MPTVSTNSTFEYIRLDIIQGFLSATEYLVELCAQTQEGKIAENDVPNLPEEIGHNVFYT